MLRENNNLDLDSYKPFINDFHKFSGDIFDFDTNIFQEKFKDPAEVIANKLRRSTESEYAITEKYLRMMEGDTSNLSPERIHRILKKLPTFANDTIDADDIETFSGKGIKGWSFLATQLLNSSIFEDKVAIL